MSYFFILFLRTENRNIFLLSNMFSMFFYFEEQKTVLKNYFQTNPKYLYTTYL